MLYMLNRKKLTLNFIVVFNKFTFAHETFIIFYHLCCMNTKRLRKSTFITFSILSVIALVVMGMAYRAIFKSNVNIDAEEAEIFIPQRASVEDVAFLLKHSKIIDNDRTFLWVAQLKKFQMPSKGGRYVIQSGWSNNEIINRLRVGNEIPVNLTFNNIRTPAELSKRIANQLALDSADMMACFNDYEFIRSLGFDFETVISIFIPNTYRVYWTTDAKTLFKRMKREYEAFWSEERSSKAKAIGYSPVEVMTIASIVDEETTKSFEKPIMAGVYINRLKRGIPLQACPTLKFALNDFTIQRVLNKYKKVDSPYNTYKYRGLPPGPIRIPAVETVDAVLNYKHHNYLFFCAKDDFSGEHYFSKTLKEHNAYARRYHKALNRQHIYK